MTDFSDPGYAYLGELLASRGYITVSVDENFLNGNIADFNQKETPLRALLLLHHLKTWQSWTQTPGNLFFHKADMTNIALIGHSRGGEAVALAATFAQWRFTLNAHLSATEGLDFPIKAVVGLGPWESFQINHRAPTLTNTNYLVLQGAHDADASYFKGIEPYQRAQFTDGQYHFKAAVYIYRANHGQFNTVWGQSDYRPPVSWALNVKPLLTGDEQRQFAKVYISAFLDATLHDSRTYVPFLRDNRTAADWLPHDVSVTQFADTTFTPVAAFEEDMDPKTLTITGASAQAENMQMWQDSALTYRNVDATPQQNSAVYLRWESGAGSGGKTPVYTITLDKATVQKLALATDSTLSFGLSRIRPETGAMDVTIELVSTDGQSVKLALSQFQPVQPPLKTVLTKPLPFVDTALAGPVERVLQSYVLPLSAFTTVEPHFDPAHLAAIRFCFDRTPAGDILLDNIGFARMS